MVKELQSILNFFNELYKVNVNINVYYIPLTDRQGAQNGYDVFINSNAPELDQEITLVHEINHVYQDMGYSVSVPNIKQVLIEDIVLPESKRRYEIDSRIVELLYAYKVFGSYGVDLLKERLYRDCPVFNNNMTACIRGLIECDLKYILLNDIFDAYSKVNKY